MVTTRSASGTRYHLLEEKIVQEDAAWIPLFSRLRYYVTSERLNGFTVPWNGSVKRTYSRLSTDNE